MTPEEGVVFFYKFLAKPHKANMFLSFGTWSVFRQGLLMLISQNLKKLLLL